LGVFYSVLI